MIVLVQMQNTFASQKFQGLAQKQRKQKNSLFCVVGVVVSYFESLSKNDQRFFFFFSSSGFV